MKTTTAKTAKITKTAKSTKTATSKAAAMEPDCCGDEHGQEHGHDHGHDHGDGECCGGQHLVCELHIRQYKPTDYRGLNALWKACDIELDETDSASALEKNLDQNKKTFRIFVGEAQILDSGSNKPVGKARIASGVILAYDGRCATVYNLGVHPEFRGVGLGRALLGTCESQAKLWGAKHLRLSVPADGASAPAHKLLEKNSWMPNRECWLYTKTLSDSVTKKGARVNSLKRRA